MIATKPETLKDCRQEDVESAVQSIASKLNISFEPDELAQFETFGELSDYIIAKLKCERSGNCTAQLAFCKLRQAFSEVLKVDQTAILPESKLADFLPESTRCEDLKKIEQHLGFKIHALEPPLWISLPLALLMINSLFKFVFHWQLGLIYIGVSLLLITIANRKGNVLSWKTFGELANKMVEKNYIKVPRNQKTYDPKEAEQLIRQVFFETLESEKQSLEGTDLLR